MHSVPPFHFPVCRREVALALLLDPELRLRVCHLEDILKAKQLHSRQQVRQIRLTDDVLR